MGCEYCEYPDERALSMGMKTEKFGGGSRISYDSDEKSFSIYTTESSIKGFEIHKISNVKYCPFCGEELKAPSAKALDEREKMNKYFDDRHKELAEEKKKKRKEHEEWLEKEYKNNPYDPSKPRLKNENFRNAVKYLAKYMGIKEFYWDDNLRNLTGWNGGYIRTTDKSIGPCYETNGVMESFSESGRTYTVEELCGSEE